MNAPDPTLSANPLLDFSGLPRFAAVTPAHVQPAINHLIAECRAVVEGLAVSADVPSWTNFVTPLDDITERLARAWNVVGHLNAVVNSPALRDAYNGALPAVTQFWTEIAQDERLFARYRALRAGADWAGLNDAQKQTLEHELRDFRLGGAELPAGQKARFMAIQEELSSLMSSFNDNVLDATNAFAHFVENEAELSGLPGDVRAAASEAAKKDGRPGWKLTLQAPCYLPVMQYADFRSLRESMYRAYSTRASELGADPKWDNSPVIRRILELRAETAALLAFENYAGFSLATKMAETPREVIAKFKTIQMVDVRIPTTDERELVLSRYTQPEPEHRILLEQLRLRLPEQPPPKITAKQVLRPTAAANVAM